jgi:excisionase family DNA binding protein
MKFEDRLRALAAALPADGAITLTRDALAELLDDDLAGATDSSIDLTVPQAAERLRRSASTVRTWCADGTLPGAYRLRGREWRIPAGALRAMQLAEAARFQRPEPPTPRQPRGLDTSAWRAHMKGAA